MGEELRRRGSTPKIKTPSGTPRAEVCSSPASAGGNYFFPDFLEELPFFAEEEAFFELDFLVAFFIERFSLT